MILNCLLRLPFSIYCMKSGHLVISGRRTYFKMLWSKYSPWEGCSSCWVTCLRMGRKTAGCGASASGSFSEMVWSPAEHIRELHLIAPLKKILGWTSMCCLKEQAVLKSTEVLNPAFPFEVYSSGQLPSLLNLCLTFLNFSGLTSNSWLLIVVFYYHTFCRSLVIFVIFFLYIYPNSF